LRFWGLFPEELLLEPREKKKVVTKEILSRPFLHSAANVERKRLQINHPRSTIEKKKEF
jgi:hypothetical protein